MRALLLSGLLLSSLVFAQGDGVNPKVQITTNFGTIEVELDAKRAPETVRNFLAYVDRGHYRNVIFHRVIKGFMIQGGGFEPGMKEKMARSPIRNEADNGLRNLTGTIAMARTSEPHSAAAQFFINTADNALLDHRAKTPEGWGYCVFGKVTSGMNVVRQIESAATADAGAFKNVPRKDIVIVSIEGIGRSTSVSSQDFNTRFEQALAQYRASNPKPELPEQARRPKIQAETLLRDRRFLDALERYEEALNIAPWWPDGHFNTALILGELKHYEAAIQAMNRYLQLVPEAGDARAARDKIYEWESFLPRK